MRESGVGVRRRVEEPVDVVRERPVAGAVPLYVHPGWQKRFPWLVQGTTGAVAVEAPLDLRLFGAAPVGAVLRRWERLREAAGCRRVVHSRQVHGTRVLVHGAGGPAGDSGPPELAVTRGYDGHVTREAGVLLTVSVADCVPIFVVDGERRAVALLHGGRRGIASGILEAGVRTLAGLAGSRPEDLDVHLGPAICGECYQVGPEVHRALGLAEPAGPAPVDLRALLVARALELGVRPGRISASAYCTKCGDSPFFSHRGGCIERQMAVLGIRE